MKSRRHTAAFTMVELLVALAIAIIVTAGLYSLYNNYVKAFIAQDRVIETQQTARIAIDTLTQDLLRAGYKVSSSDPAVVYAGANEIQVELFNDQDGESERIHYYLSGTDLRRDVLRRVSSVWTVQPSSSGVLAQQVVADPSGSPALQFTYYTQAAIESSPTSPTALSVTTPVTDAATLLTIRRVQVTLTVRSAEKDPVRNAFVYRTLRADVKPRNAGLMSTIKDNNPPAVPTGLASVDQGDCGYLYLSWTENTEPDLAGYIVYYRTASEAAGVYLNSVTVGRGTPHSTASRYPLSGLTDATTYFLAIAAFDYSGNTSAISAEITGTAGSTDTTPNVADPKSAPGSFVGTAGENQVSLSWLKVNEPDVLGYRIYRKTSAFTTSDYTYIDAGNFTAAQALLVANETSPGVTPNGSGGFTFVDNTDTIRGCTDYYYAVTAIKGCGAVTHPITSYTVAQFSSVGPKTPTDSTPPQPPAPPTLMLTAFPSYLRNYLSLTNPPTSNPKNADFVYTRVAYRTDGTYPTFAVDAKGNVTTNGTFVECYDGGYGPGSFTAQGTTQILHKGLNGTCAAVYALNPSLTYYYAAVAVDTCKNLSNPVTTNAQVTATQCSDETDPSSPAVGNPPRVTGVHGNTVRSTGGVSTSQATLAWSAIDDSFNAIRDFAGYYVARTSGPDTATTPAPTLSTIWTDSKAPGLLLSPTVTYAGLTEGQINRVRILGVDCETVTKDDASHMFLISRYPAGEFDAKASDTLIFYPGTLALDSAIATKTLNKTQNLVQFQTKTTINSAATDPGNKVEFKSMTFDWTTLNPGKGADRLLKSITIDGVKKTLTTPLPSPATLPDTLADGGQKLGFRGGTNATFSLEFVNSSDLTASKADMRGLWIRATTTYVPVTRLNSDTATPLVVDTPTAQEATVTFDVPPTRGPDITNVAHRKAGTTDSFTSATTVPPSILGGPVTFAANFQIEVAASVNPASGTTLSQVRLFYATTSKTFPPATGAPSIGGADFPTTIGASYTAVLMTCSSGTCKGTIPIETNLRVWFFVLAQDNAGNYSVSPTQDTVDSNVTYVYDQASAVIF